MKRARRAREGENTMIHMIQNAKDQAARLTLAAYAAAAAAGELPQAEITTAPVEIPKDTANGDFTSTVAMACARQLKLPPRKIAEALLPHLDLSGSYFTSAEIAGPGFLNFRLGKTWFRDVLSAVESEGENYGSADILHGEKIMVEFVSANPTGPMHMGNARGGGIETCMVFEEGAPHAFRYATPYGSLSMEAETERLGWRMTERGGLLELRYRVMAEGQAEIRSRVTLQVREKH